MRRDHLDPDMAERMEPILAGLVQGRSGTARARGAETVRGVLVAAVVGAAVVAVTIAVLVVPHRPAGAASSASASAPPSVTVRGKVVPYAGTMPWYGAVPASGDQRTLTIHADSDRMKGPIFVCGVPDAFRAVVHETAREVDITIAGYGEPLPARFACGDLGHGLQPIAVHLRSPLGHRVVRDAFSGTVRRVLTPALLPTPSSIPNSFTEDADSPRWVLGWDMLSRTWRDGATGSQNPQTIAVRVGDGAARVLEGFDGPPTRRITVQGRKADLWFDEGGTAYWRVFISWTTPNGLPAILQYEAKPARHLSLDEVVRIAESLH